MDRERVIKISTISGKAKNGKKARVLIESTKLPEYGFPKGTPYKVFFGHDKIVVMFDAEDSDRKVSGYTHKSGRVYGVIDLRMDHETRDRIFRGAEKLDVLVEGRRRLYIVRKGEGK